MIPSGLTTLAKAAIAACCVLIGTSGGNAQSELRLADSDDEIVDMYEAYIGRDDLYNSRGDRLTEAWQIIRQDRANFHRFGIRDIGDQTDDFFASANNRELLETMISSGRISQRAAREIVRGDVSIRVVVAAGRSSAYVVVDVY